MNDENGKTETEKIYAEIAATRLEIEKLRLQEEFRAAQAAARHDKEIAEIRAVQANNDEQIQYLIRLARYLGDKSFENDERFKRIGEAATGEVKLGF